MLAHASLENAEFYCFYKDLRALLLGHGWHVARHAGHMAGHAGHTAGHARHMNHLFGDWPRTDEFADLIANQSIIRRAGRSTPQPESLRIP